MQNETKREYIKRISYVLDFIEKNLDADLSLELLAQKAHYSPYHFHRTFSTIIGESLNEYVGRKRLERIASVLLVEANKPIKELAYSYGFNSESSFSRAFKKYYGISPTRFKSEGKTVLSKIGIESFESEKYICSIDNLKKWAEVNAQITIEELQEIRCVGIMHMGEFDQMSGMYQRLMTWASDKGILPSSDFKAITIYHDNPHVTTTSKVRYSACVTIDKSIKADGEIRPVTVQKGYYAIGHFKIEAVDFPKAWKFMYSWVLDNDHKFRDGDYFEVYHNDHTTHPEQKFIVDICIPLESSGRVKSEVNNQRSGKGKPADGALKLSQNPAPADYGQLINYMKALRKFFHESYPSDFSLGAIYRGSMDFSYFSLTTPELKKQKLKFVIILNHQLMRFEICLSGQNKSIRRKYWEMFKSSSWNKYHLAASIDDSLSIIDHTIVETPDFDDTSTLTVEIETESFKFINEIRGILE
ncbi:MAG: AraC family transcriptional regulator [Roseivirga sp.]|nr:AraC family transcriptional regulator [Roseivirga sp.]